MMTALPPRKPYPSDISDEEWALAGPYLMLMREDAAQREHPLRELLNGLRYVVRTGIPWRTMPHDLPLWDAVYSQAMRWMKAGCGACPRAGFRPDPWDGAKRKKGSKIHLAVNTLGHLLALHVTPASASDRKAVEQLVQEVQEATGESVEVAYVDQGYTGEQPAAVAEAHGIRLEVVRLPEVKRGFVLLPRRWVVERSFAWATRFRRLVRDYECLAQTLADMHVVAFSMLMLRKAGDLAQIHNTL